MPNYRQLHEDSLCENRPKMYHELKRSGQLKAYLDAVQRDAQALHTRIVKDMAEKNPYNPGNWENCREAWEGWLERTARELVLNDLVLVPDEETERAMRDGYTD